MTSSSTDEYGKTASNLWGPQLLTLRANSDDSLEVSMHTLPKPLKREFQHVFHERNLSHIIEALPSTEDCEYLVLATNQKAREDLVATGPHIEAEKDRLLNVFVEFSRHLCEKIHQRGYWSDFIDPCSGLPMLTPHCNKVYSEVDGMECCLGYKAHNAGFCKILTHPSWGSAVYPASVFCFAPRSVVLEIVATYPQAKAA